MLTVEQWPTLRDPVMVVALRGWVDAGYAGAGAVGTLTGQLQVGRRFAHIDLTDLLDLQQVRPTARLVDGGVRVVEWPRIELVAGHCGRDVVLVVGPEPSIRWSAVTDVLVDAARRLGVRRAVTLGGMPARASHRRPTAVLATASSRPLAREVRPLRLDYAGPTGLQTVVQHALGEAGIDCVGLWAQVPQYVAGSPSPPAARALLTRLSDLFALEVDLRDLDARCDSYAEKVEAGLSEHPDVAEAVRRLDDAGEGPGAQSEQAAVDAMFSEIERFLRSQPDGD